MKVTKNQIDDLNMTVNIALDKNDWAEPRKKKLNEFRRNAEIRGFRRGMAPMSLIEKIHGGQALGEVVNTLVTDALNKFIEDNKLNVLGEPLPRKRSRTTVTACSSSSASSKAPKPRRKTTS